MLHKVELLVGAGRPEILTVVHQVLILLFAFLVGEGDGGFFAERRIGEHIVHAVAGVCQQSVAARNRHLAVNVSDIVQIEIHQCGFICRGNDLIAVEGAVFEKLLLLAVKRKVFRNKAVRRKEKTAAAAARVSNGFHRFGADAAHHSADQRTRCKVLTGAAFDILGVLLQQALVDFTLDVGGHRHPVFLVDHLHDTVEDGGIIDFVGGALKDFGKDTALLAERFKDSFILFLQLRAFERIHIRPSAALGNTDVALIRRFGVFV